MTKDEKRAYDKARYERLKQDPAWLEKKRGQVRAAALTYYHRDPASTTERRRAWRKSNPESVRSMKRRQYWRDPERNRERNRARYKPELNREQCRRWYEENKDRAREAGNAWRKANLDRMTHYANKRSAHKMASTEHHTLAQWRQLVTQCDHTCAYCGRQDRPLTRDHIVPLSRGGSDGIANIAPACRPCNAAKGQFSVEEFIKRIA